MNGPIEAGFAHETDPLSVLNAIAAEASRTLDVTELLDLALERMIALTGMEGGAVLLVDEETQRLTLAAERSLPPPIKELLEREPLPVGTFIPGITAANCELLIVENCKDDDRELPPLREIGIMTHICIPLAVRGHALGVFGIIDRRSRSFGPSELALFTAVGEQLGVALERARLFEQSADLAVRLQADLTERERAKQAALFAQLNPAPVLRFDDSGMILSANTAALAILGEEAKKSVPLASLLPSAADIDFRQFVREGHIIAREAMVGQRHFQFVIRGIPHLGVGHVYGSDITERKQAEEALRASDAKFRRLLESAPDAVLIVNDDGRIELVNGQAEEMFGYSRDELLGESVEILLPQRLRQAHFGHRADYAAHPRTRPMGQGLNIVGRRKDGTEFPLDIGLSPLETEEGVLVTSVIRDITKPRQTEEVLRELAVLQERNRLAREIHDTLAQSLTGLVIQLEAAEDLLGRAPEAVRAEIRSARGLARESLEEARRSVWDLQPRLLEASNLMEAIRRELASTETEGIQASLDVKGNQPESMDRRCELTVLRIAQEALTNIRHHARANSVAVRLAYGPTEVRLQISDDGVGFDPSVANGLLSPNVGGFGLTSMQERARLAGGHIEVRSAPGMGTQVEAHIPYHPGPEEAGALTSTAATANVPQKGTSGGIRVLIVDDHEVVRRGIRNMLEQADDLAVVGEAADGEAAVEQIGALAPDVVLLDIQMPKLDGIGMLRRLRELGLETRVILLSVYGKDEQIFEGLRAGARGYLLKDVARDDLTHAIRTVHKGVSLLPTVTANRLIERLDSGAASRLTERELEVLRLLATGARNKEIADRLFLSAGTVKFHLANVYEKLGVHTRTEAVRVASERGLLNM